MAKGRIYVLDDEVNILQLVKYNLEDEGYSVKVFKEYESFLLELKNEVPELIILDIMMPVKDGFEVMSIIRREKTTKHIPIIFLSAKAEEIDRVFGMEMGADDYLVKPFSIRELLVRVKAMLRRESRFESKTQDVLTAYDLAIDISKREVLKSGKRIELTFKEYELLKELIQNQGMVMSRNKLVENVWGLDFEGDERTIDVHVRCLRQKLEDDSNEPKYIETIRGIGYRFIRR